MFFSLFDLIGPKEILIPIWRESACVSLITSEHKIVKYHKRDKEQVPHPLHIQIERRNDIRYDDTGKTDVNPHQPCREHRIISEDKIQTYHETLLDDIIPQNSKNITME